LYKEVLKQELDLKVDAVRAKRSRYLPTVLTKEDDSMDAAAFRIDVSKCLVPHLWKGAVVVMDNLPAHKVKAL
jgi:hypothetical protein